jgi:hypothetical protein
VNLEAKGAAQSNLGEAKDSEQEVRLLQEAQTPTQVRVLRAKALYGWRGGA